MPLDMTKYGFDAHLPLSGTVCECPATEADPKTALVIFLIGEWLDSRQPESTESVVTENADFAASILAIAPRRHLSELNTSPLVEKWPLTQNPIQAARLSIRNFLQSDLTPRLLERTTQSAWITLTNCPWNLRGRSWT